MKRKTAIKFFLSIRKEQHWLEQMALAGWKLQNIMMGIVYRFESIAPARLLYEIDRFEPITENMSSTQVRSRDEFLSLANEMGWETVTRDESLNYYFSKAYSETDCNELYADEEGLREHGAKFARVYRQQASMLMALELFATAIYVLLMLLSGGQTDWVLIGLYMVVTIVELICISMLFKGASLYEKELSMTKEEWEKRSHGTERLRVKLPSKAKKAEVLLKEKAVQGWQLCEVENNTLIFQKADQATMDFAFDTEQAVKARHRESIKTTDNKDWMHQDPIWNCVSLSEAEALSYALILTTKHGMVYARDTSDQPVLDTGNRKTGSGMISKQFCIIMGIAFAAGFIVGLLGINLF